MSDVTSNQKIPLPTKGTLIVGGAVRDTLLQRDVSDRDWVVLGSSPEEMLAKGYRQVGGHFPVFLHPQTQEEYALARIEAKDGHGYGGFDFDFSPEVSLEDDLARRDLTINSMAMDRDNNIFDPYGGQADLAARCLRHTSPAFEEDPVRVLRVARLRAQLGTEWHIAPETLALMDKIHLSGELEHLTPERVWMETSKALMSDNPQLFFETMEPYGLFPEVERMRNVPQPASYHPEGDVWNHTMLCIKRAADQHYDLETRFAVLCHDFGKPVSYKETGTLIGHEANGLSRIRSICQRLKIPNNLRDLALKTSAEHTLCHGIARIRPAKVYGLINRLGGCRDIASLERFANACQCDSQGRGPEYESRHYEQKDLLLDAAAKMRTFDHKKYSAMALESGKKGPAIGEFIRNNAIKDLKLKLSGKKISLEP